MNRIFIFAFFLIFVAESQAQHTIRGKIVSEQQENIPYANVKLLTPDSTFVCGSTTDSLGIFSINNIHPGRFLLSASHIGYTPAYRPIDIPEKADGLLSITLKEDVTTLGEVTIKGSSFIRQKDRVLILPDKQQIKHGSTGYDLLYNLMIPGIDVNRRNGSVTGLTGSVSLYINGQKADFREVQSLRPRDVEKVEYFDTPTGKYAGEKMVINYITKQYKTGGYVSLDGTQNVGYLKGDYNITGKISHKKTDYTFFGGYSMNRYNDKQKETEFFHLGNKDIQRDIDTHNALTKNQKGYAQLNIDNRTEKRTLSGKFGLVWTDAPNNLINKSISYNKGSELTVDSKTCLQSLMPTASLYGSFQLTPKQTLNISLKGNYTNNKYDREYAEGKYHSSTDVEEQLYTIDFTSNYNVLLKHQNSAGIQISHLHQISSSSYSGDYASWDHLWTGETLLTAQYNQRFRNKFMLSIQGGVNILNYRIHGNKRKNFLSPYCNLMMNYRMTPNQSLLLSFNKGNSNPPINMVSDVDQIIDSIQIQRGNPALDKANYYVTFLMYNLQTGKFNIAVSGYWFGVMPTVSYNYYVENEKLINSYHTDGNYHQIRAGLSTTYKANRNLRFKAEGYYQYYEMTGKFAAHQAEWICSLDANYYWKDFAFNVYAKSTSRKVSMYPSYMRSPALYGASISWNNNNWNMEIGTSNTFSHHNRTTEYLTTDIYQYNRLRYNKTDQATGYIKIAYTFDFGRQTARDSKDVDMNINSGILKAK